MHPYCTMRSGGKNSWLLSRPPNLKAANWCLGSKLRPKRTNMGACFGPGAVLGLVLGPVPKLHHSWTPGRGPILGPFLKVNFLCVQMYVRKRPGQDSEGRGALVLSTCFGPNSGLDMASPCESLCALRPYCFENRCSWLSKCGWGLWKDPDASHVCPDVLDDDFVPHSVRSVSHQAD